MHLGSGFGSDGISHANLLPYEVEALRALMSAEGTSTFGPGVDFAVLFAATAVIVIVAGKLHPRIAI